MKVKSKPQSNDRTSDLPAAAGPAEPGLFLRGKVERRWKRLLDSGTEVVSYLIDGLTVNCYSPGGDYLAVGQVVELAVRVNVYQGKNGGLRFNLVLPSDHHEGEF